eukprot:SAG22_NODE_1510_length_4262_cov_37.593082_4_plen_503_part_01
MGGRPALLEKALIVHSCKSYTPNGRQRPVHGGRWCACTAAGTGRRGTAGRGAGRAEFEAAPRYRCQAAAGTTSCMLTMMHMLTPPGAHRGALLWIALLGVPAVAAPGAANFKQLCGTAPGHVHRSGAPPPAGAALVFGDALISVQLDAEYSLLNVTVCSPTGGGYPHAGGRAQGFVPGGAAPAPLWQLNTTDCETNWTTGAERLAMIPGGVRVDGATVAAARSHKLTDAQLSLRWDGVRLPAGGMAKAGSTVSVVLNLSLVAPGRLAFTAAVSRSAAGICLQALALPNLPAMHLRSPELDTMFLPQFFGHIGDAWGGAAGPLCGSGNCDLDQASTNFATSEYAMPRNCVRHSVCLWTGFWRSDNSVVVACLYCGGISSAAKQLVKGTGCRTAATGICSGARSIRPRQADHGRSGSVRAPSAWARITSPAPGAMRWPCMAVTVRVALVRCLLTTTPLHCPPPCMQTLAATTRRGKGSYGLTNGRPVSKIVETAIETLVVYKQVS